jgi:hypothetical protein
LYNFTQGKGGEGEGGIGLHEGKEEGPMCDLVGCVECKWEQATPVPCDELLGLACVMSPLQLRYSLIPVTMFHRNWFM